MHWRKPTADELEGTLYSPDDYEEETVEVYSENLDYIALFQMYQDQWRFGFNGPICLDMTVFHHALDRKRIPDDEYDNWVYALRVIQDTALAAMKTYT